MIVPHASGTKPLQVFSGPNFVGDSTNFGTYTYYTNAQLGPFRWNIGSFRLMRGYSATFAQYQDGTGASKVYVAQDGDLEVGLMPTNLDHQCLFVRVFPWRWTAKKGWGGGVQAMVDPHWNYDWNNAASSTYDTEYIPMKWGGFTTWDPYSNLNSKQGTTQVLGYNEPDSTAQANVNVSNAIALWPYMMQSGLRLGAPAVSDSGVSGQGLDWLYSFMSQATNLGYRVDYIPVHFYKCSWSTTQFSNYLAGIYQVTGRPIWVTEFNNGASWCGSQPTQSGQASTISSFLSMLESTPFVERYAIYSWFGSSNLDMIYNSVLTPAGTNYLKQQSTMAYAQEVSSASTRATAQLEFENNCRDTSGYANNGMAVGLPSYVAGHTGQGLQFDGASSYVQLPPNVGRLTNFTFAAWVYWNGGSTWQRIFDFGSGTSQYMFLTPSSGGSTLRFAMTINTYSSEQTVETTGLTSGMWYHVAVTVAGSTVKLYTNGALAASSSSFTIGPNGFKPSRNYLGKSQFSADPYFNGILDEVQVADYAFTAAQIAALQTNTAPQFTTNQISGGTGAIETAYSGTLAGSAADADTGNTITYSKASGPAWLTVASDGTLSGTPTATDGGTNAFVVRVTDTAGASDFAVLTISIPFTKGNGTWYVDAAANWSDASKWTRTCVANGAGRTADFSVLDIAANRTVTLDSSRSIGNLRFADESGSQAWTLASSAGSVLTLDTGSATSPSVVVGITPTLASSNGVTISASLDGTNGFTKTGFGALFLTGANPLSGTLNIDSGSTYTNEGFVRLGSAGAGSNLSAIYIRNNNSGMSTLQLAGGVVSPAAITLSGRTANLAAIQNISGSNYLSGNLSVTTGGANYLLQSDAGTLNWGGILSSSASGTRNFTFQGAGDHYLSGSIANGSGTVTVNKQDAGNLILANTNSFTGNLSIGGGAVRIATPLALQANVVNLACAGTNGLRFGAITAASVGSLFGISDLWLTNTSLSPVTLTNGANNSSSEFRGGFRGAGSLVKAGAGTMTLSGTNTLSGSTTVAGGTLKFGAASNIIAALQPVLWFDFDSASSTVVSNLGYGGLGMNGAVVGTGAFITNSGRFGKALCLSGAGTNAATNIVLISSKVMDTSASASWTIGFWLKTSTPGATVMYQGDGGWSSSGQTTYLLNGNAASTAGTKAGAVRWGGGFLTGTTALNDGAWHFVTLVDTAGTETIYVDGVADTVTSSMANSLASGASQTWIGGSPDSDTGATKMAGLIDELCMFSRALSVAEIRAIYTNAPTVGKASASSVVNVAPGAALDLSGISQAVAALGDYNSGGGMVTNRVASPVTLTLAGGAGGSFSGVIGDAASGNAISLIKNGSATQTLTGTNTYSGATTINTGSLYVNGALGAGAVTVAGGTLGGSGVIGGPVVVQGSGALAPGAAAGGVGAMTINSTLTLGGTTLMDLDKSSGTNDSVVGLTSVQYGGTLAVSSLSGTLAAGDKFTLFSAAGYSGAFTGTSLPALGYGLVWNTNTLSSGILSIDIGVAPQFSAISQASDGNFQFSATGAAGVTYGLDATTNLAAPIQWTRITNGVADQTGALQLFDVQATNFLARFYRISAQ
jgi:autotransporter-associated beta strand protein